MRPVKPSHATPNWTLRDPMRYTLGTAAKATGKSKTTLQRAIVSGYISAIKLENGGYSIDPAELHRVFPLKKSETVSRDPKMDTSRPPDVTPELRAKIVQRRAQIGLNKGEAHHALKNALRIGRQGEIRDRTAEGQHFRMAGLNLLAAIVIYWNTKHLGQAVAARKRDGINCSPNLLARTSPLGWAHILLTGEYRWPKI